MAALQLVGNLPYLSINLLEIARTFIEVSEL
jgi:hypothetical protein